MSRRSGKAAFLLACFATSFLACVPSSDMVYVEPEPTPCVGGMCADAPTSGMLSQSRMKVTWEVGSSWDQGHCVDLTLTNLGGDVDYWSFSLRLSAAPDRLLSFDGAWLELNNDEITVSPCCDTALPCNEALRFQYCTEPAVIPEEMLEVNVVEPSSDERTPVPTPDPEEVLSGSLQDDPLILSWRTNGTSKGGTCLEMTVLNVSEDALKSWRLDLSMSAPFTVTDQWGMTPVSSGNQLSLYPSSGGQTLESYDSTIGTVCLSPLVTPRTMSSSVTYTDSGGNTGGSSSSEVVTGSLVDEGLLFFYEEGVESNGGTCLNISLTNTSSKTVTSWSAKVVMSGTVHLTDSWTVVPAVSGSTVTLYPGTGMNVMAPSSGVAGAICLSPLVTPLSMDAVLTFQN